MLISMQACLVGLGVEQDGGWLVLNQVLFN